MRLTPLRDLGPRIAHFLLPIPGKGKSNWGYAWIPVVGPILGGALGAVFYKAVFNGDVTRSFLGNSCFKSGSLNFKHTYLAKNLIMKWISTKSPLK